MATIEQNTAKQNTRTVLTVSDMECAGCAEKIERALREIPGVSEVSTSVMSQKVTVHHNPHQSNTQHITSAIRDAGFSPDDDTHATPFWHNAEKVRTLISGLFFFAGLITSGLFPHPEHGPLWTGHLHWTGGLYLFAALVGGINFFPAGWRALKSLSLDMDFLMTAAIIGAALIGEHMEAAAIAFLFSTAELLEDYAVDRARNSLQALMALAPDTATVRRDGNEITVPVEEVERGECLIVRPGDKIPLDGQVRTGLSAVDQSPITGESMPVTKKEGDGVFAGTINKEGYLEIEATKPAGESTLSRIIQLVEEAEEKRAPSEQFVRKFARYYTPAVTLAALGIILIPTLLLNGDFITWFVRGLTLLVIACPCALVISTPVAVISGITSAARNGVLIKGGNHLEALGGIQVIAFDKTGTLTNGTPEVTDIVPLNNHTENDILRLAAALEYPSKHPVAQAIVKRAGNLDLPPVENFASLTGRGVRGQIENTVYTLGKPDLFSEMPKGIERLQNEGKTVVLLGTETEQLALIAIADTVRSDAQKTITALHKTGLHTVMLTGDNPQTANAIARQVGIDEWHADLLPEDKVHAVETLQKERGPVAMIGDGVNDAPALVTAEIGIAMGAAGTDTALETADVALMADDLSKLPYLFTLSQKSRGIIRQNVALAILVKFGLAAGVVPGLVTLVVAVLIGDMGTSLAVIGNAMRLART